MSAQKKLASEKKSGADRDETASEAPKSSPFGTLVRFALIAGLLFFMLKPYLFKTAPAPTPQAFRVAGETMGTTWNAVVCVDATRLAEINSESEPTDGEIAKSCEEFLERFVQRELDKIDGVASTYRSDSEVSKFNRSKSIEWFPVSAETAKIVAVAQDVAKKTGGAFDVTVAPIVDAYRFGPNKSPLVALPTDAEIAELRARVGFDKLEVRTEPEPALRKSVPELTIDLSGVAKGFAVDRVAEKFESVGLTDYMVEVGGEVRCGGLKSKVDDEADESSRVPWVLGVETPEVAASAANFVPALYRKIVFGGVEGKPGALATSGDYRNFLQVGSTRFSHIIDPRVGKPTEILDANASEPAERLGSVSVVAASCAEADAFATALFVLGEKDGIALADQLGLACFYLFRTDDSATETREVASKAFGSVDSLKIADEKSAENAADSKSGELKKSEKSEKPTNESKGGAGVESTKEKSDSKAESASTK